MIVYIISTNYRKSKGLFNSNLTFWSLPLYKETESYTVNTIEERKHDEAATSK